MVPDYHIVFLIIFLSLGVIRHHLMKAGFTDIKGQVHVKIAQLIMTAAQGPAMVIGFTRNL
jgi:hypothetical protein